MTQYQEQRAAALAKSKPYKEGPFAPGAFIVSQRDTHHFDIYAPRRDGYVQWYLWCENPKGMAWPLRENAQERAFAIRGEPGDIYVRDERWDKNRPFPRDSARFSSVAEAIAWVLKELTTGAEQANGQ